MKKIISAIIITVFSWAVLMGCQTSQGMQGAGIGGALGGIAGALLDHKNPWRGAMAGAALGAILGGSLAEMSAKAAKEAAASNRQVAYRNEKQEVVRATPVGYNPTSGCREVKLEQWDEKGRAVGNSTRTVC